MQTIKQQQTNLIQCWTYLKIFENNNGKGQNLEISKALEKIETALNLTQEMILDAEKIINENFPKKDG